MYIAKRYLTTSSGIYRPEEPIPDADNWNWLKLRQLEDLGWIEKINVSFTCEICGKSFASEKSLQFHKLRAHKVFKA